jgi:hypothetical protein
MSEVLCIVSGSQINSEKDDDYTYTFYTDGTYYCTGFSDCADVAQWAIMDGLLYVRHKPENKWHLCNRPDDRQLVKIIEFELEMKRVLSE